MRVMQDSDRRIELITRQPIVRRQCRASVARADGSPTREMFQGIAGDCAGEAFIYRNGEADFVFDIVVWVMLSCGAAIELIQMGGKDFALRDEPTMARVKFGKDLDTNGKAEDYTDGQKKPNYTAQKTSSAAIGHQGCIQRALVEGLGWRHVGRSHTFILCVAGDTRDLLLRKNHQTCELERDAPGLGRNSC